MGGGAEHGGVVQPLLQHHHRHLRPGQRRGGVGAGQAAVRARVGGGGLGVELQTKVREDFTITEKAPTRTLKGAGLRHYAKWALRHGK